jgi:hypothetical protein
MKGLFPHTLMVILAISLPLDLLARTWLDVSIVRGVEPRVSSKIEYLYVQSSDGEVNLVGTSLRRSPRHNDEVVLQGFINARRSNAYEPAVWFPLDELDSVKSFPAQNFHRIKCLFGTQSDQVGRSSDFTIALESLEGDEFEILEVGNLRQRWSETRGLFNRSTVYHDVSSKWNSPRI